jgi:hypothetical protein
MLFGVDWQLIATKCRTRVDQELFTTLFATGGL